VEARAHPSEVVNVGDELDVRVLKFDRERNRVSWASSSWARIHGGNIARRYPSGYAHRRQGPTSPTTAASSKSKPGVEGPGARFRNGLDQQERQPGKVVQVGDDVEVMVLDVDEERRRISLGIKQCRSNPWEAFAAITRRATRFPARSSRSPTSVSSSVWTAASTAWFTCPTFPGTPTGEDIVRNFKKGDDLEAVVLAVDPERERISLGIKQLEQDPFGQYMANVPEGQHPHRHGA
jgi:small subunit ribosomal protein S1